MSEAGLITNPNADALRREPVSDEDAPRIRVHRAVSLPNFDAVVDDLTSHLATKVVEIDAKILEGRRGNQQIVHYKNLREFASSPTVRARLRKSMTLHKLQEVTARLKESSFERGMYADEASVSSKVFPLQDTFLPQLNSPYAKQQTFHDYMSAHVRCWEAATRNPLGKRIVKLVPQFVLSRGLTCDIPETAHQEAWNEFWLRHGMSLRLKVWLRELMTYGEQFNRHFKVKGKLVQRQIDPCTVWDVVTKIDDIEDVDYYYQQYIATSPIVIPGANNPPATLVIRHIPADEVDHYTINKTSSEKRGRSELYAVLGWMLRFKEFMNDRIMANKMRALFALDVSVKGGPVEVAAANAQFATPPGPGSVAVHNDGVQIEYKNMSTDAADAETDAQLLLKIIAVGAGVSEQFLGVSTAGTRASALLQTEPDVKNFEDYQQVVEDMLHRTYRRMVDVEKLPATKKVFEVSFPALAAEDRSVKLKDLAMAEAQEWISHERAATNAAREFGVTGYDYDAERGDIQREKGDDLNVMQGFQSVPKEAPDPMAMAAAGGAGAADTSDDRKVTQTSGQMGYSAKGLSGRGLANTKATLDRASFTRGGEAASLRGQKSAGAPLRASAGGWTPEARDASLFQRRTRKLDRLMREVAAMDATQSTSAPGLKATQEIARLREVLGQHADPAPAE